MHQKFEQFLKDKPIIKNEKENEFERIEFFRKRKEKKRRNKK